MSKTDTPKVFQVTRVSEVTITKADLGRFRESFEVNFPDEDWSSDEAVVNTIDYDWWAGGYNSEYVMPVSTVVVTKSK